MTNEQLQIKIRNLNSEIHKINTDWINFRMKIITKNFKNEKEQILIEKKWDKLDSKLFELNKKLEKLQTVYYVDFFNDQNLLTTALLRLNRKMEINTHKNGWKYYIDKADVNELFIDIHEQMSRIIRMPNISNIKST